MTGRGDAHRRQAPRILDVRIQIDGVSLDWQLRNKIRDGQFVIGLVDERLLVARAPGG